MKRPDWAEESTLLKDYYDHEWGFEEHNDQKLFEILCMQSYQIGLNRQIVLSKREGLRHYFNDYQIDKVANMTSMHIDLMMINSAVIRNKMKLDATINNAKIIMKMRINGITFDQYIWKFEDYGTSKSSFKDKDRLIDKNNQSVLIAKQMRSDGFKMIDPVTIYSFMLAIGMINARV